MAKNNEMNIKQIKEIIKFSMESSETTKLPVCLSGLHGIGKTEVVKQVAKENNYNLVILHLALQDTIDLIGIPREKDGVQFWSCPDWLHLAKQRSIENGRPTLFFLDELNRANKNVLAGMLPFLIEGALHTHTIGPKDAVIAAVNPPTDSYEVNEIIDEAFLNRLGHVIFKPTHSEYVDFCSSNNLDKTTLKVIKANPALTKLKDFDLHFEIKPSRRSIYNVMSVIGKKPKTWIKQHAKYVIEAYLGTEFSDLWLTEYSNKDESITLEMLKDFDNNVDDITKALSCEIDKHQEIRLDIMGKTVDIVKSYLADQKDNLSVEDVRWMIKFLSLPIIPNDYTATIFKANPIMKRRILEDYEINRIVVPFLQTKGLTTITTLNEWK